MSQDLLRPDNHELATLTPAQYAEARGLQLKGATLSEIARLLGVDREAVVDCLCTAVANRRAPRVIETIKPKMAYAGLEGKASHGKLRLKAGDGRWLHMSGDGFTLVKADSWIGTPEQLGKLRQLHPVSVGLTVSAP